MVFHKEIIYYLAIKDHSLSLRMLSDLKKRRKGKSLLFRTKRKNPFGINTAVCVLIPSIVVQGTILILVLNYIINQEC